MFPDFNSYNQFYGGFNNDPFNSVPVNSVPGSGFGGFNCNMFPQSSNNNEEILNISQAVELIRKSVGDERADELFYEQLINQAPSEKEKNIICSIRDDEKKHNSILRELYFNITGQMIQPEPMMNMENNNNDSCGCDDKEENKSSYKENLEKGLFGELDAVVKYRRILGAMPSGDSYILVMSIMTDELRHSAKFNYLIHKAG